MNSPPVRVILNDRCLRNARTGVGHYVCELLAALPGVDPGIEILPFYRTYVSRGNSSEAPAAAVARSSDAPRRAPDWLRRVLQRGYEIAFDVLGTLRGHRLYHEPNHIPGVWNGPIVTTIHDLSVLRHPSWHPPDRVRWYERDFVAALPRTTHFISVSEFTRREMVQLLGIEEDRITAVPLGPRSVFHPRRAEDIQAWLKQCGLPSEYLLFTGTLEPRKNVSGLLAAYARMPEKHRHRFPLLMAGAGGWGTEELQDQICSHGLGSSVQTLGYVTDEDLGRLYAGARALVWPTLYEGFGLPPLECMATGTPVITSDVASLPEVVGDAGLLIDPTDIADIAEAMRRVIEDDRLVREMADRGIARSQEFSWRQCAAAHARIYRRYAE